MPNENINEKFIGVHCVQYLASKPFLFHSVIRLRDIFHIICHQL